MAVSCKKLWKILIDRDMNMKKKDGVAQESVSGGKNVSLGRATVSGALFGSAGAIVGGMSVTKKVTRTAVKQRRMITLTEVAIDSGMGILKESGWIMMGIP